MPGCAHLAPGIICIIILTGVIEPVVELPEDIGKLISQNPLTGERMELLNIDGSFAMMPPPQGPGEVQSKSIHPGFGSIGGANTLEQNGWSLNFFATEDRGMTVSDVRYRGVFYIYFLTLPWVGQGTPCNLNQFQLSERIAGPFVLNFPCGFALWARYGFANGDTMDQAYYFFEDGTLLPLMLHIGPTRLDYVPLYIDFDVINTANNVCNYYPPVETKSSWNLAVTEFSRRADGATPPGENYNIMITNQNDRIQARALVEFNLEDNAIQYVADWVGFDIDSFPLFNLRGLEIVNTDVVYLYLANNPGPGLFGPRIRVQKNCYRSE